MPQGYGAVRPVHGSARLVNHTDMAHSPNFIGQLLMAEEFTPLILIAGTQSEFGSLDNFTQALTALDSVRLILLSVWMPCRRRRLREPLVEAGSDYMYARCRQSMTADDLRDLDQMLSVRGLRVSRCCIYIKQLKFLFFLAKVFGLSPS